MLIEQNYGPFAWLEIDWTVMALVYVTFLMILAVPRFRQRFLTHQNAGVLFLIWVGLVAGQNVFQEVMETKDIFYDHAGQRRLLMFSNAVAFLHYMASVVGPPAWTSVALLWMKDNGVGSSAQPSGRGSLDPYDNNA